MYFKEETTLYFKTNNHSDEKRENNMILKVDFKIHSIQDRLLEERQNLNQEVKVKVKKMNKKAKVEKMNQKVKTEKIGTKKEIRAKKKIRVRIRKRKRKKKGIKKGRKRVRTKLEI
jgi:hypothetical protein